MTGRRRRARRRRSFLRGPGRSPGYSSSPSTWSVAEGLFVAFVGTVLVVGSSVYCVLAGPAALSAGEAGAICTLALALYLLIVRAGRVLVGAIVLTGLALSVLLPRVTAEIALTERGHRQDVIVTAVQTEQTASGRGSGVRCTYAWEDGAPVSVRIRRGCGTTTSAGEHLTVLFDPKGVITPRAVGPFRLGRFVGTAALTLALPLLCVVAVARSYRLPAAHAPRRRAAAGR
ncbi:hypothetical protein QQY66_01000 [Streptomyces sp. DG2A-72]|uniref:hypothetical protein n=1 Tax=Streptomyces sp. DG2A-72 TaxID=3051386 RepID=UPI00265BFCDD|nr:hypothetical protein [Streptomyces sp. DG2A-72]MDO0930346.1 hypothetical protein [Streptomyces sp. DG2A-72]